MQEVEEGLATPKKHPGAKISMLTGFEGHLRRLNQSPY
jgi:hypothetical protein